MINDREREALMRLTMCARHECKMCIFQGFDSEVCYRIATDCMHILADALNADRKTENSSEKPNNCELQTIRCPKCGRTDYIRDMEKDMGIKDSHYKYKCINCNFYIKTEPTISKTEQVEDKPQTEPLHTCSVNGRPYSECSSCEHFKCTADEPQTDCGWK